MKTIIGKPISPGYAQGRAVILGAAPVKRPERSIPADRVDAELGRFHSALDDSYRQLQQLQARVASELGPAQSEIFSAHLLFLKDPQLIERVEKSIKDSLYSVEWAMQVAIDELVGVLNKADSAYLRERAADIRDLQGRLLRQLAQSDAKDLTQLAPESVLVARELLPSDFLELDREHVVGVITEVGGETAHAAILARALGVPAVTGVTEATQLIAANTQILIDGQSGEIVLNPLTERIDVSIANKRNYDRETRDAVGAENRECVTRDGHKIRLLANIGRPLEVEQVVRHHLEGVGLLRTEYLFLDQPLAPSFERQRQQYQQIAASLGDRPLTIRTLDLGGDKRPAFMDPLFEANPNLGVRGLRFSLTASPELFRTQVRAALHTAETHDVRIMLPMVLAGADLGQAITVIREVAEQEEFVNLPPIGALIETPAAVFAIEEILAIADFISIGTNDLTQFILAADRNALAMIDDYTVLHPSVLRAVHQVIEAADLAAKPVTICGEAAADPRVACLLVGLGARGLSMSPVSAARVRFALRACHLRSLEDIAQAALACNAGEAVVALANEALRHTLPECCRSTISV